LIKLTFLYILSMNLLFYIVMKFTKAFYVMVAELIAFTAAAAG